MIFDKNSKEIIDNKPDAKLKNLLSIESILVLIPLFLVWYLLAAWLFPAHTNMIFQYPALIVVLYLFFWVPRYVKSISYKVDENGVQLDKGVFFKKSEFIPYDKISYISLQKSFLESKLGLSTLRLYTNVRSKNIKIVGITDPVSLRKKIVKNMEKDKIHLVPRTDKKNFFLDQLIEEGRDLIVKILRKEIKKHLKNGDESNND